MKMLVQADIEVDLGEFERDLRHEYGDEYEPSMLMPMAAQAARDAVYGIVNGDDLVDVDVLSERPV